MATVLTCGGCERFPYSQAKPLNETYRGAALNNGGMVYLVPNTATGLTTLNVEMPIGVSSVVTNSTTRKILITAGGYTADNVGNTGAGSSTILYTVGAATVVGSISSTAQTFKFTITFPSALADDLPIKLQYYTNTSVNPVIITVAKNFTEDPCASVSYTPTELVTQWNAYVCYFDFCGGDTPGIYINGEGVATFDSDGKLVPVQGSAYNLFGGLFAYVGNPSACNCTNAYSLTVGAIPGLDPSLTVEYKNGSEIVPLDAVKKVCTYTYDFTGTSVAAGQIVINGLLVNNTQMFGGVTPITAAAGTLAQQLTSIASQLSSTFAFGTWTATATTIYLLSDQVFGTMIGLDGAASPAPLSESPTRSC